MSRQLLAVSLQRDLFGVWWVFLQANLDELGRCLGWEISRAQVGAAGRDLVLFRR